MTLLNTIQKNKFSVFKIENKEYDGHAYIEIREWRKYLGKELAPTKNAITANPSVMKDIAEFLRRTL